MPLEINLLSDAELTAMRFGIGWDSRLTYVENLNDKLSFSVNSSESMAWLSWAGAESASLAGTLWHPVFQIPENAAPGDVYEVRYREYGAGDSPAFHTWKNLTNDYVISGEVSWTDGYIHILEEETTTAAATTTITTSASVTTASTTPESVTTTNETTTETKLPLLLKESEVMLKAGQQYQIEANQTNLTYSSNHTNIAVVSSNGIVTALKEGSAVISIINQDYDVVQINLTVISDNPESEPELGDLTQDEKVDASDAAQILVAAARQGSGLDSGLTETQKTAADVNHDGKIDASDAAYILQYAAAKGAGVFSGTLSEYMSSIL